MTREQSAWLAKNRSYTVVNHGTRFVKVGLLHADGTFDLRVKGKIPRVTQGCFEVGVREDRNRSGFPGSQMPR